MIKLAIPRPAARELNQLIRLKTNIDPSKTAYLITMTTDVQAIDFFARVRQVLHAKAATLANIKTAPNANDAAG